MLLIVQIALKVVLPITVLGSTGTLIYTLTAPKSKSISTPVTTTKDPEVNLIPEPKETIVARVATNKNKKEQLIEQIKNNGQLWSQKKSLLNNFETQREQHLKEKDANDQKINELNALVNKTPEQEKELADLIKQQGKLEKNKSSNDLSIQLIKRVIDELEQKREEEKVEMDKLQQQLISDEETLKAIDSQHETNQTP